MMELTANAKINLGLDVLARREDGYHEVRMVMQTLALHDTLTLELLSEAGDRSGNSGESTVRLTIASGDPAIDVSPLPVDDRNLCVKAAKELLADAGANADIAIHLTKCIPFEAGLAGGSTDAAAVLIGINELLNLQYTNEDLAKVGVRLGADIPYCIYGGTMLAEGIGEKLTAVEPGVSELPVLLVKPDFGVSTGGIYGRLDAIESPRHPDIDGLLGAIRSKEPREIAGHLGNVLEEVTIAEHPKIEEIKTRLERYGALGALMTGSGPTVFGVFGDEKTMTAAKHRMKEKYNDYYIKETHIK